MVTKMAPKTARVPISSATPNIGVELLQRLTELIPGAFIDGRLDPDRLRVLLGDIVDNRPERFVFGWAGKLDAIRSMQAPSTAALAPDVKASVNFNTTKHVLIEGENLEVLKLLYKSYFGRVRMIYIDPPYNTGKDRIYHDDFSKPLAAYLELTKQRDEAGPLVTNPEAGGRFHSTWLSMMFPRLFLARQLLREDGFIFVSIDDNEVHHLRLLLNEVFGEENWVAELPVISNLKGNNDQYGFAGTHEYVLVYARDKKRARLNELPIEDEDIEDFDLTDEIGPYKQGANLRATGKNGPRKKRPNLWYPIYVSKDLKRISTVRIERSDTEVSPVNSDSEEMSWRWEKKRVEKDAGELFATRNGKIDIFKKQRLSRDDVLSTYKPKSILYKPTYSSTSGMKDLEAVIPGRVLDNPKAVGLLKDLVTLGCDRDGVVMDFFAGSGTLAQAVLELNRADHGNRRFILIQLPELVAQPVKLDGKTTLKTIADICAERVTRVIRRLAKESQATLQLEAAPEDLGVRVFRLTESNFARWVRPRSPDAETYGDQLEMFATGLPSHFTPVNVLWEVVLKEGLGLTSTIERLPLKSNDVDRVTDDELSQTICVCLDDVVERAIARNLKLTTDDTFVCRDSALTDTLAANLALQCRLRVV